MQTGALTQNIDVAQVVLYAFWVFFAGLVFYLRREDRREGYPLEVDKTGQVYQGGFPFIPEPKTFILPEGGTYEAPDFKRDNRVLKAERVGDWPGAAHEPLGDPLVAGIGPGAWAERKDEPDLDTHGRPSIRPLSQADHFSVLDGDPNPIGFKVIGNDGKVAGKVADLWIDCAESLIRYIEVDTGTRRALIPNTFAIYKFRQGQVYVHALAAHQFANVPHPKAGDRITKLEEEKVMAYFGAGTLFSDPKRAEPLL